MRKIDRIALVFENTACFDIFGEDIVALDMDGITSSISVAYGEACESKFVNCLTLCVSPSANKTEHIFPSVFRDGIDDVFKAIEFNRDIAQIHILYQDNTTEWYYIKWGNDQYNYNERQETEYTDSGHLVIDIGNKRSAI